MPRAVTQREADILREFGFKLAKGREFETVNYNQIVTIVPTSDGMDIHFVSTHPLERTHVKVVNVDIPSGKFVTDGSPKRLDNAWCFVYYESTTEHKRDGTILSH